jgi:hypothetical protein
MWGVVFFLLEASIYIVFVPNIKNNGPGINVLVVIVPIVHLSSFKEILSTVIVPRVLGILAISLSE